MPKLVLDANMIVVFVIGQIDPRLLGVARRVKQYQPSDFELIATYLNLFTEIILLPTRSRKRPTCSAISAGNGETWAWRSSGHSPKPENAMLLPL